MNQRVTVDAKALYDLIQSARADKESLICVASNDPIAERKALTRIITRLGVQEITA